MWEKWGNNGKNGVLGISRLLGRQNCSPPRTPISNTTPENIWQPRYVFISRIFNRPRIKMSSKIMTISAQILCFAIDRRQRK